MIEQNVSLLPYNTFGLTANAAHFYTLTNIENLPFISSEKNKYEAFYILGGGSNLLLTQNINGLVLHINTKGITLIEENENTLLVRVSAGELWQDWVQYALNSNWGGIENLTLIPGTVGAAPIQNIGAYGVEVKEVIEQVTVWNWDKNQFENYNNKACMFGYRDSIFKTELKGKILVTSVDFRLNKKPTINPNYGAIKEELLRLNYTNPTIQNISLAVANIRNSKLPNPKTLGNSGSFFKNPIISTTHFNEILPSFPSIPYYTLPQNQIKIPAGWLIEQCGYKGFKRGAVGVHEKQSLVLVNYGGAKGLDILNLSNEIITAVAKKFKITLEREVQIWN